MSDYLTIAQAADSLSVHPSSVWRAIQVGSLEAIRFGRIYRIHVETWAAYKRRLTYAPRHTSADVPFGGLHAPSLIDKTKPVS